jgi:hypothetical protein
LRWKRLRPSSASVRHVHKPAILVSGALVTLFGALFIYASIAPPPSKVPGPFDPHRFMAAEESDIRARLADPEGAKFRNESASTFRRVPVVCGEINVKNSTNGYVGFRRFVSGPTIRQFEDSPGSDEMSRLWLALCDRAK